MIKTMIEHYAPLLTSIKTMFGFKTSSLLGASVVTSISIEGIVLLLEKDFLGVPIILTSIVSLFILLDWVLGTAASIKLAKDALLQKDSDLHLKYKFRSTKVGHTIFKFMSLFLWLLLAFAVNNKLGDIQYINSFFDIITVIPVLLFGFREYISIGEDMEVLTDRKYYLFTLAEKVFEILQLKFLNKLEN